MANKRFKISIQGFGAEVTIGSLDKDEIEKISSSTKSLDMCVLEDFDDWRDKDDQYHNFGACHGMAYYRSIASANGNTEALIGFMPKSFADKRKGFSVRMIK